MTAKIIMFPVPKEKPLRGIELILSIFDTAAYWKSQGLGPEDVPVGIESHTRQLIQLLVDPRSYKDSEDDPELEGA